MSVTLINNCKLLSRYFSALHNSMTKLCSTFLKCENKLKLVEKLMHSFELHSNESACRKVGRLGLEKVTYYLLHCVGFRGEYIG